MRTIIFCIFILSYSTAISAELKFNPYWTLKTKTGQSINIVKIETDYDANNQLLIIYTSTSGTEGFIDPSNFANSKELTDILEGKAPGQIATKKEQKIAKEKALDEKLKQSEVTIENTWHEYSSTYVVVSYINKTNKTFNNAVTIKCAILDSKNNIINTNSRTFFNHEYGPIKPGFQNSLKIPISDVENQKVKDVACTCNEW